MFLVGVLGDSGSAQHRIRRRVPVHNRTAAKVAPVKSAGQIAQATYEQVLPGDPLSPPAGAEMTMSEPVGTELWDDGNSGVLMDDCTGCGLPTCGTMCGCMRFYGGVEYLMWWDKSTELPVLVTTSPAGTPEGNAGIIGSSEILFGVDDISDELLPGGRLTVGTWLGGSTAGVVGRLFAIESEEVDFTASSQEFPILARPFFNAFTGEEDALLLGFPGQTAGDIHARWESEINGADVGLRQLYCADDNYRIDMLVGYRYMGVDETLSIANALEFIDENDLNFGTVIEQSDLFDVRNRFHGVDVGFMGHSVNGCWTLDFIAKVALGNVTQDVAISGTTTTTPVTGSPVVLNGGLLTQNSNIGQSDSTDFAAVPEGTLTLGFAINPCLDLSVGYTFLYISRLARAESVIDRSVNLTQQTGPLDGESRPAFRITDTDYWLQGINFGLSWRY
jgi:hypothetical protein